MDWFSGSQTDSDDAPASEVWKFYLFIFYVYQV
jgi:hypothetical protein